MMDLLPVSYTHLDVYKRQAYKLYKMYVSCTHKYKPNFTQHCVGIGRYRPITDYNTVHSFSQCGLFNGKLNASITVCEILH